MSFADWMDDCNELDLAFLDWRKPIFDERDYKRREARFQKTLEEIHNLKVTYDCPSQER